MFGYYPIKYDSQGIKKPDYSEYYTHKHRHHHHHTKKEKDSDKHNQEFGYHGAEDYARILGEGQAAQNYVTNNTKSENNSKDELDVDKLNMQSTSHPMHTGKTGIPGCGTATGLNYPHTGHSVQYEHHRIGMFPDECPGKDLLHMGHDKVGIPGCGQSRGVAGGPTKMVGSNMNSKNIPMGAQDTTDPGFGPQTRNVPGAGRIGEGNDFNGSGIHNYCKGYKGEFIGARMNERNVPVGSEDTTDASFGPQSMHVPGAGRMANRDNLNGMGVHDYSKGSKGEFIGARMNEKNAPMSKEQNMDPGFAPQTMNSIPGAGRMGQAQHGNVLLNNTNPQQVQGESYSTGMGGRKISVGSFEDRHDGEHAFEEVPPDTMHHDHLADMPHQQKYNYAKAETVPRSQQQYESEGTQRKSSIVKKVEKTLHIGSE